MEATTRPRSRAYPLPRANARVVALSVGTLVEYRLSLVLLTLTRGLLVTTAACVVIALAYLAKSALGIDLFPGPSPLHDLLYPLIRG
jgi:hypothetical protein